MLLLSFELIIALITTIAITTVTTILTGFNTLTIVTNVAVTVDGGNLAPPEVPKTLGITVV